MSTKILSASLSAGLLALSAASHADPGVPAAPFALELSHLSTFESGLFAESAAEIVAHDPSSQRLFAVNAASGRIDILDISHPGVPVRLADIDLSKFGADVNSVAVHKGLVAAALSNDVSTDPGRVVFLTVDGQVIASVEAGALPDMVTFTPDGKHVLIANEGEPSDDYLIDPEGSVTIVDLPEKIAEINQSHVRTARFTSYNGATLDPLIRIFGPGASVAQDLEPEYIAVSEDSATAWVSLQENNAMATLDVTSGQFVALNGLGFQDHLRVGNELDVSDRDESITIASWPVLGMYQPDAIAAYRVGGRQYVVTANEGDARDYAGFSEESRFRALSGAVPMCDESPRLQNFLGDNDQGIGTVSALRDNANMGRLTVTTATGLREDGSCYEDIYAFGSRSFSIWDDSLRQVFDSGSDFERITAAALPEHFNASNDNNDFDNRSDNKGPEPEGVAVAKLWGRHYAFIGLERVGGVMVYDITVPRSASFVQYINRRDFGFEPGEPEAGDLGAEGLIVIEASRSPIPGVPLLVVANEVSGTTSLFRIDPYRKVGR